MNIGIISINMYTKGLNFACPLHTFAFQQFLSKNGIASKVIDYKPVYYGDFDLRHPDESYTKLVDRRKKEGARDEEIAELIEKRDGYRALRREREVRHDKFRSFIDRHYDKTDRCYDSDLLEIEDPGFDCYICATDVIWKKEPTKDFDRGFFLASKAMENKGKVAYAASRGVHFSQTNEDERRFLHWVDDIDFIGVRESSLKEYLEEGTDKEVALVLDPVLLHERDFYDALAVRPTEEKYLFLYYVMERAEDTLAQAAAYAKAHDLTIVEVTDRPLPHGMLGGRDDIRVVYRYDIGIEEWLGYFKYADVVFTNSFHASCFSILFEKEFFVGPRSGDKVTNILDLFDLGDRRFGKEDEVLARSVEPIDYARVRSVLEEKRRDSKDFLLNAIEKVSSLQKSTDYEWWKREQHYPIRYLCDSQQESCFGTFGADGEPCAYLESGSIEYRPKEEMVNDGLSRFVPNGFYRRGYRPAGWKMRFRIDNRYFWYLEDGSIKLCSEYDATVDAPVKHFEEQARIPYIPVDHIGMMVAEALWEPAEAEQFEVIYNSGAKGCEISSAAEVAIDNVQVLASGSVEFFAPQMVSNDGSGRLMVEPFSRKGYFLEGWRLRLKVRNVWYWLLEDGSLRVVDQWSPERDRIRLLIAPGAVLPVLPSTDIERIAVQGVWRADPSLKARIGRRLRRGFGRS